MNYILTIAKIAGKHIYFALEIKLILEFLADMG